MRYANWVGLTGLLLGWVVPIGLAQPVSVLAQTPPAAVKLTEAQQLVDQGDQLFAKHQYEAALATWSQALGRLQANPDRWTESLALGNIGLAYYEMGDYPKAIRYHEQRLAIARELKDQDSESSALVNLGAAYQALSNYPKAVEYYEQILLIGRLLKDRLPERQALGNLGGIYVQLGQYQTALTYLTQGLTLARAMQDRRGEGQALGNMGLVYTLQGDYPKAINYIEQRLAIMRELANRRLEGDSLIDLGVVYAALGDYAKAIDYAEQSLTIARSTKDVSTEMNALSNLGGFYVRVGNHRKGIEYQEASLTIARKIQNREGEGTSLNSIGASYREMGEYPKAIEAYQTSLTIAQEIGDRWGIGNVLGNLGIVSADLGQNDRAIRYYEQSLAIFREIENREGESLVLNNLGQIHRSIGNYTIAIDYQKQGLAIAKMIQNRNAESVALSGLGFAFAELNRYAEAESSLRSAIVVFESLRTGLSDANKVSLAQTQSLSYQVLQVVLAKQNQSEAALEVAERGRGRAFAELLATRLQNRSITEIQKIAQAPDLAAMRRIAKTQNATLVEYSLIADLGLYIWVIKPNGEIKFHVVELDEKTPIAKLVAHSRNAIGVRGRIQTVTLKPPIADQVDHLAELHRLLIAPIAADLPSDPDQQVVFLPQGELFLVPFAALKDAQGKYLIEQHTISTAPSIQTLELTHAQVRSVPSNPQVLVVGDPTMPQVPGLLLQPLPGARREAIAVAKMLNTQPLIGDQATKATILKQMPTAHLIHLATHGLLETVAGEVPGALAFAPSGPDNGLLSAGEIFDLKLNADLVVLSACNTGQGEITGDGVVGLSRSLVAAGVPSVVVSLWAVNDDATSVLMNDFYRHLQTNPNKAQALRQAMLTTMQQYPNPVDWAAFTLIGESDRR
jgi:CHAT domain-containing protein/Tfp pilus assembly protein PilF